MRSPSAENVIWNSYLYSNIYLQEICVSVTECLQIAYHPINNEMLKNIFFVAVCETHSVLLKLLMFNFKLFTQRSRMLRLNWMHFLHFCKQKYRIKLLHCAKDIIRTKRLWGKLKYRQQICLAFTISNTHQKLFAITILLVFINRS